MSRYTVRRGDQIDYAFWLIFSDDGDVRMSRGEPNVSRGEVAMACRTVLPLALFTRPVLSATLTISPEQQTTFHVDVKAASEALSKALGVNIDMRIQAPPEGE